ncbi:hypothetical protein K469DRAFT_132937 [Zopfia rhizophila CBS 207.26]|uniref:Myb-like domain-containing protein n=1 Tax=Zopfia rhizophila CBS 207.26 TaxID=1314779 RepID=A0A6A6ERE8_9PEZI|nr:hypothetical protein K469DRAFT_132937 [Zopfia rhizophila CBS 207.26]
MSALECLSGESTPAGPEDVINSEIVEGAGIQGSTPTRRERVYTGGELSSTPKKRKLDQLNRPEDVNYNSDASARDGKEVGQSLRARKQRKSPTSHKNSLLDSQLPQEGTYRNSGNNNHDIKENRIEDERTVSTTPRASPSHQEPTSFRDMGPSHDEVGDGSHNHSLDGLIDDSTEEEEEEEDGSGSGGDDNDDDNKDESNDGDGDEDEKEDSSSDSEDDKDDGNNGGRKGQRYAERQRFSTSIRGSTASKRAVQRHPQQHRHSTSSVHESDRSTTYTSNLHKPLAHPKRSPRRARKPSLTDCLPESEGALKEASCANKGEWPIQGFLRRKRNGLYAMEFSLDHHHHQLPPPVDFVRQAQRLRPRPRFTAEEDALLIELKEEQNLLWERIRKHFPGRTVGSLQVHYSTKLKDKTAVRKRR